MMSTETIRAMSRKAARDSQRAGQEPLLVSDHDRGVLHEHLRHMPFLGDRCPRGWVRVPAHEVAPASFGDHALVPFGDRKDRHWYVEVDASGFGQPGELALTFSQFCQWASEAPGELGYALVEVGQFQVVVGVFRRRH